MRVPILPDPDPTVSQVSVENDFSLLEEDQKGVASLQHSFASAISFANEPCFLWIDDLTWVFYLGGRRFFLLKNAVIRFLTGRIQSRATGFRRPGAVTVQKSA